MPIQTTIRITGLEDVRRVIAAGLAALGHNNIDLSSIRFDGEAISAEFRTDVRKQPLIDFNKVAQLHYGRSIQPEAEDENA